jgi:hypothetical protein
VAEVDAISIHCAREWVSRSRRTGAWSAGSILRPWVDAQSTSVHRNERIVALGRLRLIGPEIAEVPGMAL